jgi:hypothetical protein
MNKRTVACIAFIACALPLCAASQAQETPSPTQFSVGLKVWNASWSSYLPAAYGGVNAAGQPVLGQTFDSVEGDRRTNVLPQIGIRHDKFFMSASYGRFNSNFTVAGSPLPVAPGTSLITSRTDHFTRRESDLAIGYYVTPELVLTLGYKRAVEDRDTRLGVAPQSAPFLENKANALLLGASGSFPVQGALRLYTTAGYGPARLKTRFADPTIAGIDANGRYLIGEIGFSHPLPLAGGWLRGVSASFGYRTQTVKADSRNSIGNENRDLRDVRDGLVFSVTASL